MPSNIGWTALGKLAISVGGVPLMMSAFKRKAMAQSVALVQSKIKEAVARPDAPFGPLVAGKANNLLSSWVTKVTVDGDKGSVSTPKIYSEIMDQGRKPGSRRPPIEAIENWIKDKRIVDSQIRAVRALGEFVSGKKSRTQRTKRKKLTGAQQKQRMIRSMAFLIARSIGRKGIKGRRYVAKAERNYRAPMDKIWAGVRDAIAEQIDKR